MTKIPEVLKGAAAITAFGVVAVVGTTLAPIVSLIAIPIFTLKAIPKLVTYAYLNSLTFTNGKREQFGRIPGQDYTRWDGKAIKQLKTEKDSAHEKIGQYVHGKSDFSFRRELNPDCPFTSRKDLKWLEREVNRITAKDLLDGDLKMIRAFSKALIPIAGVVWVIATELGSGGASQLGCSACGQDDDASHWGLYPALSFHMRMLGQKLGVSYRV